MSTLIDAGYIVTMPAAKINARQSEIDELRAENERLRVALGRAADDIESWGAYASSYFQEKWNLQADIDAARAALGEKS